MVDAPDMFLVQSADVAGQPLLVYGANLLQKDKRGLCQSVPGVQVVVGGQLSFDVGLAGDGGDNDGGAVLVAYVVLDDNDGPGALLLRADDDFPQRAGVSRTNRLAFI